MRRLLHNQRGIIGELLLLVIAIAAIVFVFGRVYGIRQTEAGVTDYVSCRQAGYPVQQSYPTTCRTPDGRTFTGY